MDDFENVGSHLSQKAMKISTLLFLCVLYHHIKLSPFITDIDECANPEMNECDGNALCTNTEGSYVCRCLSGYQGDGYKCTGK